MSVISTPGSYPYGFYPPDPYIGMCIFDSTYGKILFYYGQVLGWLPAWGIGWGWVADVQLATTFGLSGTGEQDITGLVVTWNTIQNRRYLVQMNLRYSSVPESIGTTMVLTDGANLHKMEQTISVQGTSQNKGKEVTLTEQLQAYASGAVTRKGRASRSAPADTKNIGPDMSIRVYDVGSFAGPVYGLGGVACVWNTGVWNSNVWS